MGLGGTNQTFMLRHWCSLSLAGARETELNAGPTRQVRSRYKQEAIGNTSTPSYPAQRRTEAPRGLPERSQTPGLSFENQHSLCCLEGSHWRFMDFSSLGANHPLINPPSRSFCVLLCGSGPAPSTAMPPPQEGYIRTSPCPKGGIQTASHSCQS